MNKEFAIARIKAMLIRLSELTHAPGRVQYRIDQVYGEIIGYLFCLRDLELISQHELDNLSTLVLFTAYPVSGMTYGGYKAS